jgi:hypothetical protein
MKKVIFSLVVVLCLRFLVTCDSPSSGSGSGPVGPEPIPENAIFSDLLWKDTTIPYLPFNNLKVYYTLPYSFEELGYEGGYPEVNTQYPPVVTKGTVITVNFTNTEFTFSGIPEGKEILFLFTKVMPTDEEEQLCIGLKAGGSGTNKKLVFTANELGSYFGCNVTNFKDLSVDRFGNHSGSFGYDLWIVYPYRAVKLVVNGVLYNKDHTGTYAGYSISRGPKYQKILCSGLHGSDGGTCGWGDLGS